MGIAPYLVVTPNHAMHGFNGCSKYFYRGKRITEFQVVDR